MGFLTTWAVDGSRTPAAVARLNSYASLKRAGVVGSGQAKLLALGGGSVGLSPGAIAIPAGSSGTRQWQMYVAVVESTDGDAVVDIPVPVSTARTLHAVVAVPDPELPGEPVPPDPLTENYGELRIITTSELNSLTTPHYRVATLSIPADAGSITQAMITDTRRVAVPQKDSQSQLKEIATPHDLTSSLYIDWPGDAATTIQIPEWATRAIVRADLFALLHTGSANVDGWLAVSLAGKTAGDRRYDEIWKGSTDRVDRTVIGEIPIEAADRGQVRNLRVRARRTNGSGYLRADTYSSVNYVVDFFEDAV